MASRQFPLKIRYALISFITNSSRGNKGLYRLGDAILSENHTERCCVSSDFSNGVYVPNLSAARARALAASSSRFLGGAVVSSERSRRFEIAAISSIAVWNAASLALDGLLKPVIFLTN